jgi:hypothetical protein
VTLIGNAVAVDLQKELTNGEISLRMGAAKSGQQFRAGVQQPPTGSL